MRSVMITGASTPIGRALIERLAADPELEHLLAVTLHGNVRPELKTRPRARIHQERADLTRPREAHDLLFGAALDLRVDTIIHTAFHRSPSRGGPRAHALNVDATRELVRLAERHPTVRTLVLRSHAEVYRVAATQSQLIDEDSPLNLSAAAPQWIRDRVEADLAACVRMGMTDLKISVLRCAECLAPNTGSQLHDYLSAPVCFRPIGFDPMINVITLPDLTQALTLAARRGVSGIFNIPGYDTLPLSEVIYLFGKREIAVPDVFLDSLYRWRTRVMGTEFRYDLNQGRFHLGGVLRGARAAEALGYRPKVAVEWPRPGAIVDRRPRSRIEDGWWSPVH